MIPLKEAIAEKHKIAERMPFNAKMIKGLLSKEQYMTYLLQLKDIHTAIEAKGLPHTSLARLDNINMDIEELLNQQVRPGEVLRSTQDYVQYLNKLSEEECLPHVYMHYLAIAYGGQMIKKVVPSSGKYYEFDQMQEAIGAIRAVQKDEWVDEVNKGFDYIIDIFEELDASSSMVELSKQ